MPFLTQFRLPFLFLVAFSFLNVILYFIGAIPILPNSLNLTKWDAAWYLSIAKDGYFFDPEKQSNVAFFPLFPLVWKFFLCNPVIISLVNSLVYLIGAVLIFRHFTFTTFQKLFLLSSPLLIFCYLPYAEAYFFLFGAFLLIGLKKNMPWLAMLGLLGAGLSRAAIVTFVPALLFLIIMNPKTLSKTQILKYSGFAICIFLSLAITTIYQYLETGVWFGFQKTHIHWNHHLQFPSYALHSFDSLSTATDLASLSFGLFCGFELLILFLNRIGILQNRTLDKSEAHYFSLAYGFAVSSFVFLFQGGELHSLNRYVLGTVYFWLIFDYILNNLKNSRPVLLVFSIILVIYAGVLFGDGNFKSLSAYLKILSIPVALLLPIFLPSESKKFVSILYILCIGLLFFFQIHNFHLFLEGKWIG